MVAVRVKAVWSSVRVVPGVLCVMMPGELMMPLWSVDSWVMLMSVSICTLFTLNDTGLSAHNSIRVMQVCCAQNLPVARAMTAD